MKLAIIRTGILTLAVALAPALVQADTPGRHPAYLRARTDLRTAQALTRVNEEPNVMRNLRAADREIDVAVRQIDRAAVIDRKDIDDHPRPDAGLDRMGRFRKIVELLRSSRMDLAREEDNGAARGWRNAAYQHIDAALELMHRAAVDLRIDHELGF
ncbi:MAG TPA: hypothetical protein VK789_14020 [Bryobacteraceae bacterium]|nr:hypothetical protein [Bryobacteraceae bacterium]